MNRRCADGEWADCDKRGACPWLRRCAEVVKAGRKIAARSRERRRWASSLPLCVLLVSVPGLCHGTARQPEFYVQEKRKGTDGRKGTPHGRVKFVENPYEVSLGGGPKVFLRLFWGPEAYGVNAILGRTQKR